ncbi:hypothetical protein GCM10009623_16580 [Nocardioides aestuarii]|uniref:DUF4179 domain-containing protein n=1 Tax=Nocardioides aestuarii TaxID=252231 RepID=A0ABW4TNX6_9ACTN
MNTLDDLRRTLDHHAHDVHDDVVHSRTAAVRGRAVAVRRRRVAGVATAAALVVAGALVTPRLVSDTDPQLADRTLIGQVAPASMRSLGYTYRFVEGVEEADGNASVRLDASDTPRLLSWASAADDVTLYTAVEGQETPSERTAFDDFTYVSPGESGRWAVRGGGEPTAIAVYELDDDVLPAGTTVGRDITFRQEVGSEQLVAAGALSEGEAVLTVTATVPENQRMRVAEFCQGVPSDRDEDLWVVISVDGDGGVGSGGCDHDDFDPATGDAQFLEAPHLPAPGEQVEVRMWVARGVDGDPIAFEGSRLALGLYDVADPAVVVGGWDMAPHIEHEGHEWRFVDSAEATVGERRVAYTNTTDGLLLAVGSHHRTAGMVTMRGVGDDGVTRSSGGLGGSSTIGVLPPGGSAQVTTRKPLGERGSLGLALYERID